MSNDPVNPELRRVGRLLPRGIASDRSVRLARWVTPLLSRRAAPSDVEVHPVGQVRVRLFRPVDRPVEPSPALLWIHGGGYVWASPPKTMRCVGSTPDVPAPSSLRCG